MIGNTNSVVGSTQQYISQFQGRWIRFLSSFYASFHCSVQFSLSVMSDSATPWIAARQASLSITTPGVNANSCPSSQWCHPAISSSLSPSSPAPNSSQHQGLFQWVNSSHEVARVLEFQLQHQSFQCPRSSGCAGTGGLRGATPCQGQEERVRRYSSPKVRSNGCTLLEQPWRDTLRPR